MKPGLHAMAKAKYKRSPGGLRSKAREIAKRKGSGSAWNEYRKTLRLRKQDAAATHPRPTACECCHRPAEVRFDHDHRTGKFRGWLCDGCNLGIGKLGDNLSGVRDALAYLERV